MQAIRAGSLQCCASAASRPTNYIRGLIPHAPMAACKLQSRRSLQVCSVMSASSSNPAFTFGKVDDALSETGRRSGPPMTVDGAVTKTALFLAIAAASGSWTWMQIFSGKAALAMAALGYSQIAGMVGLAAALVTMFKPQWSAVTGTVFSVCKGIALAGLTAVMEVKYPGIAMNATILTFGTAASLLAAYKARIIKVTDKFRDGVMMCTGAYFLLIMCTWLFSMVGLKLPSLLTAGPVGIAASLLAVGLASANLLLDFDMIRSAANERMPKWFEWYSGFSLMVTLVWMYTEVLRLLASFVRGRED